MNNFNYFYHGSTQNNVTIQVQGSKVPSSRFEIMKIGQLFQKDLIQNMMQHLIDFCATILKI